VTPLDATVGILLVVLCGHAAMLMVLLVRGGIPQRRHPQRRAALLAGIAALLGELLSLKGLLGRPASPLWVFGLLGAGVLLALVARPAWREHPAGRAAVHALVAAPLVVVFVVVLSLR
jgi:hypothetical protein